MKTGKPPSPLPLNRSAQKIRVYLVDRQSIFREGLKSLFRQTDDLRVVGETDDAELAIREAERDKANVVITDMELRNGCGMDICRAFDKVRSKVHVLILTSRVDEVLVMGALDAGACGYLLKNITPEELKKSVRAVVAGELLLPPEAAKRLVEGLRAGTRNLIQKLSPQEMRVAEGIATGKTNKEIAASMNLSTGTVKNYLSHILRKLNLKKRAQVAALFAQTFGPAVVPLYSGE